MQYIHRIKSCVCTCADIKPHPHFGKVYTPTRVSEFITLATVVFVSVGWTCQ